MTDETYYIKGDDTAEFLNKVSRRLSGRDDCKGVEFEVTIQENHVTMKPLIYVFPDTHHRSDIDKLPIINFILHLSSNKCYKFTFGTYKYGYADSITKKKRRWIRVK